MRKKACEEREEAAKKREAKRRAEHATALERLVAEQVPRLRGWSALDDSPLSSAQYTVVQAAYSR